MERQIHAKAKSDLAPGGKLRVGINHGNFLLVQQAIGTPRGRDAGAAYLREFAADIKSSGLVARTIERHGVRGVSVAP